LIAIGRLDTGCPRPRNFNERPLGIAAVPAGLAPLLMVVVHLTGKKA
jgi:hypothetical protein